MASKEQDRTHKARESETFEQTVHRQEQNRMHMATSRITCTAAPGGVALQCLSFLMYSKLKGEKGPVEDQGFIPGGKARPGWEDLAWVERPT